MRQSLLGAGASLVELGGVILSQDNIRGKAQNQTAIHTVHLEIGEGTPTISHGQQAILDIGSQDATVILTTVNQLIEIGYETIVTTKVAELIVRGLIVNVLDIFHVQGTRSIDGIEFQRTGTKLAGIEQDVGRIIGAELIGQGRDEALIFGLALPEGISAEIVFRGQVQEVAA